MNRSSITRPAAIAIMALTLPQVSSAQSASPQEANATFLDVAGKEVGTAVLTEVETGVLIRIEAGGLPPSQWLGFHIHESGNCDSAEGHASAGGHFNPDDRAHGYLSESGPHAGDMANIRSDAEGFVHIEMLNPNVTLGSGQQSIRGRALMVHAGSDDHLSQPSGGAGDRLACAAIP